MRTYIHYLKYAAILVVAFFLMQFLIKAVFVSDGPELDTGKIAIIKNIFSPGGMSELVAMLRGVPSPSRDIASAEPSEETKQNLMQVSAVAPRIEENGVQVQEYGNVARISIPRALFAK